MDKGGLIVRSIRTVSWSRKFQWRHSQHQLSNYRETKLLSSWCMRHIYLTHKWATDEQAGGSWKFFERQKIFCYWGNQLFLFTFPSMSPPPSGKKHSESGLARFFGSATSGVLELFIFHPVDTVAKRLMSNQARVSVFWIVWRYMAQWKRDTQSEHPCGFIGRSERNA